MKSNEALEKRTACKQRDLGALQTPARGYGLDRVSARTATTRTMTYILNDLVEVILAD